MNIEASFLFDSEEIRFHAGVLSSSGGKIGSILWNRPACKQKFGTISDIERISHNRAGTFKAAADEPKNRGWFL
jgi:hypothetical protein